MRGCTNCLCATCKANKVLYDTRGTNICVGCEKCDDFQVDNRGQCPLGKYERVEKKADKDDVKRYSRLLNISNRVVYGAFGMVFLMSIFVRDNIPLLVVEVLMMLVGVFAFYMHRKYTNLLSKLNEGTIDEKED